MWTLQARIERALQGNFLFNGLTEKQRRILYDCMEKWEVEAGDVIIRQVSTSMKRSNFHIRFGKKMYGIL